jgi:hypothetical protein
MTTTIEILKARRDDLYSCADSFSEMGADETADQYVADARELTRRITRLERQINAECLRQFYTQTVGGSVLRDFATGNVQTIHAD